MNSPVFPWGLIAVLLASLTVSSPTAGDELFQHPLSTSVGVGYGQYVSSAKRHYHAALDYYDAGAEGVLAAGTGVVVSAIPNDTSSNCKSTNCWYASCNPNEGGSCADHGYGNVYVVAHATARQGAVFSQYSHLAESPTLSVHSPVTPETVLGVNGGTGYGCETCWVDHLHFEMKEFSSLGAPKCAGYPCFGYTAESDPSKQGYLCPAGGACAAPVIDNLDYEICDAVPGCTSAACVTAADLDPRFVQAYLKYASNPAYSNPTLPYFFDSGAPTDNVRLGCPADNGGGIVVHDINGVWIQDFHQADAASQFPGTDGWSALVAPSAGGEAFLMSGGFWGAYKCIKANGAAMGGTVYLGAPIGDEAKVVTTQEGTGGYYILQEFEDGYMWWVPTDDTIHVHVNSIEDFEPDAVDGCGAIELVGNPPWPPDACPADETCDNETCQLDAMPAPKEYFQTPSSAGALFYSDKGYRHPVTEPPCGAALSPPDAVCRSEGGADLLAVAPVPCSDGSFIKKDGDSTVYAFVGDEYRPLCGFWSSADFEDMYGVSWDLVLGLDAARFDAVTASFPIAEGGIYPAWNHAPECGDPGYECGIQLDPDVICWGMLDCGPCPTCGQNGCEEGEDCLTCPDDCGACECVVDNDCSDDGDLCNGTPICEDYSCVLDPATVVVCPPLDLCDPATGTCEACTPACAGKTCGPDGCGGTCGQCVGTAFCSSGTCVPSGPPQSTACGNITSPTTWSLVDSPVLVTCDVTVKSSLVIEPGVVVQFEGKSHDLIVDTGATLLADGQADQTIVFTSDGEMVAESWGGIYVESDAAEVTIRHAELRYGGETTYAADYPISISGVFQPTFEDITFLSNRRNAIELRTGTYSSAVHLNIPGIPYLVDDADITINQGVTMTIDPGVILRLAGDADLLVHGRLVANGTVAQPITLTSDKDDSVGGDAGNDGATAPAAEDWGGIALYGDPSLPASEISHTNIRYGGETAYAADFPIWVSGTTQPDIHDVTIASCRRNAIGLKTGSYSSNVQLNVVGIPYYVEDSDITINAGVTMTIDPGVIVKLEGDADLNIDGRLVANGTSGQPIILTSYRDDSAGGDSNADGFTGPGPEDWGGIVLEKDPYLPPSELSQVTIRYGGETSYAADFPIWVTGTTQPEIHDVTIVSCRRNAIGLETGAYSSNVQLNVVGIPYYVENSDITINAGVTMTIDPGVVVKFQGDADLNIDGRLIANGTPAEPIVLTSYRDDSVGGDSNGDGATGPAPEDWGGIVLEKDPSLPSSQLTHLVIRYGGETSYAADYPIWVTGTTQPTIEDVLIEYCRRNAIGLDSGPYSADAHLNVVGIPYYVASSDLKVNQGVTLTVDPGVVVKIDGTGSGGDLNIHGTLVAEGTVSEPIVFTSYRDDSVLGDSNGDGSTGPQLEDWGGILFSESSTGSIIRHARLSYAGESSWSANCALRVETVDLLVEYTDFTHNEDSVCIYDAGAPDLGGGALGSAGGNQFFGHSGGTENWAVFNGSANDVSALGNWWGYVNSSHIDQIIFDQKDDAEKGVVIYGGFQTCVTGEPCDDGDACTMDDTCVVGGCAGVPYACDSPGFCETAQGALCDGVGGCVYPVGFGDSCDDGEACTHSDFCQEDKSCAGISFGCVSPGACEALPGAQCDGAGGCTYPSAPGESCDDGNPCTHSDSCHADKSCAGTGFTCDNPGPCETAVGASCDGVGGCSYPADVGAPCDDGDDCSHSDACSVQKQCLGIGYACDAPGSCETTNGASCDGSGGCDYPSAPGAACDDGNPCTHTDSCEADKTCQGIGYACENPGACEIAVGAVCDGVGGCAYPADLGASCDDEDLCTHSDGCQDDKACAGTPYLCDDPAQCETTEGATCDGEGGCEYLAASGESCEDGDACTHSDTCQQNKICLGMSYVCIAPGPCQILEGALCNGDGTCSYAATPGLGCDDQDPCTIDDSCLLDGTCSGEAYECASPGLCQTAEDASCNGDGTCTYPFDPGAGCDDDNPCTMTDICQGNGSCVGTPYSCGDPGVCETDAGAQCTGDGTCAYVPLDGGTCDDGDACTTEDLCAGGDCTGTPLSEEACDDGNPCTDDTCEVDSGCVNTPNAGPCDDGDLCTENGCDDGACVVLGSIEDCCLEDADCGSPEEVCDVELNLCVLVACRPCESDADCGAAGNLCMAFPSGDYCTVQCDSQSACAGEGVFCSEDQSPSQCVPDLGDCQCIPDTAVACVDGQLISHNSCLEPGEIVDDCGGRGCVDEACCPEGSHEQDAECVPDVTDEPDLPDVAGEVLEEVITEADTTGELSPDWTSEPDSSVPEVLAEVAPEPDAPSSVEPEPQSGGSSSSGGCARSGPRPYAPLSLLLLLLLGVLTLRTRTSRDQSEPIGRPLKGKPS